MSEASIQVPIVRFRDGARHDAIDVAAGEAALEIRVDGQPYGVLMRTPGDDRRLAAGYLLSERLIASADDVALIEHCVDGSDDGGTSPAIVRVSLEPAAAARAAAVRATRREILASAACGVCGRAAVDTLCESLAPLGTGPHLSAAIIAQLPDLLRRHQPVFASTGGLHAAALFDCGGAVLATAEDVGRHNAVDKVIGDRLLRESLPVGDGVLCVSGRTSFEIVQKAWCARIPIVASVSAPSSLAVSLASSAGITLIGFVRAGGFNIYTRPERVE